MASDLILKDLSGQMAREFLTGESFDTLLTGKGEIDEDYLRQLVAPKEGLFTRPGKATPLLLSYLRGFGRELKARLSTAREKVQQLRREIQTAEEELAEQEARRQGLRRTEVDAEALAQGRRRAKQLTRELRRLAARITVTRLKSLAAVVGCLATAALDAYQLLALLVERLMATTQSAQISAWSMALGASCLLTLAAEHGVIRPLLVKTNEDYSADDREGGAGNGAALAGQIVLGAVVVLLAVLRLGQGGTGDVSDWALLGFQILVPLAVAIGAGWFLHLARANDRACRRASEDYASTRDQIDEEREKIAPLEAQKAESARGEAAFLEARARVERARRSLERHVEGTVRALLGEARLAQIRSETARALDDLEQGMHDDRPVGNSSVRPAGNRARPAVAPTYEEE